MGAINRLTVTYRHHGLILFIIKRKKYQKFQARNIHLLAKMAGQRLILSKGTQYRERQLRGICVSVLYHQRERR